MIAKQDSDALHSLGRAAESAAIKDDLTAKALRQVSASRRIMYVVATAILLGIGYVASQAHDINTRSAHNQPLLVCLASSDQALARDLHLLAATRGKAPASQYKIPNGCKLIP